MSSKLYVDDFDRLKNHRYPGDKFDNILSQPRAFWFGWDRYDKKKLNGYSVERLLKRAGEQLVTLVLYNITNRDRTHYSKGGTTSFKQYKEYVDDFADGITRECIVIVEPDASAHAAKFNNRAKKERFKCLRYAINRLLKTPARVYIDIGHPNWLSPAAAAKLIEHSKLNVVHGFSVNVSNFISTDICIKWADKISERLNGMHYVIDTSRNGATVEGWCNPSGAKLGQAPTLNTGHKYCDAFLWIKMPEESDGKDGSGAPHAGIINLEYAKQLVE